MRLLEVFSRFRGKLSSGNPSDSELERRSQRPRFRFGSSERVGLGRRFGSGKCGGIRGVVCFGLGQALAHGVALGELKSDGDGVV